MPPRRRRAGLRNNARAQGYGPSVRPNSSPVNAYPRPQARRASSGGGGRRIGKWLMISGLGVLLLAVGYYGYGIVSTLLSVTAPSTDSSKGIGYHQDIHGTVFVLSMGSDERRDQNGNPVPGGDVPHSDTLVLFALDTDNHTARMLSIPRDLLVSIPDHGSGHRINEAYTIGELQHLPGGGPALAVRTVTALTGIEISYYAVTTFEGFTQMVDAVGGVVIDVSRPLNDHQYPDEREGYMPVYIPAGRQLMSGTTALQFVRSRHDDPASDFGRNQRQQQFLKAFSAKMLKPERVAQAQQLLGIVKNNARTNLSPAQLISLATSMLGAVGHITGYAIGPDYTRDPTPQEQVAYGDVLIPNKPAIARLVKAFLDGTPPPSPSPTP